MQKEQIEIGKTYTYYPAQLESENMHFPAVVEAIGRRIKIRVFALGGGQDGYVRHVSARRLECQLELL